MDLQFKMLCAALSVLLSTIAFVPYAIEMWKIRGDSGVRPTVSGWISWAISDAVILTAMIANGKTAWQFVPYTVGAFALIVWALCKNIKISLSQGEGYKLRSAFDDWDKKDTVCVAIVVTAIAVWAINHNPDHAIFLTLLSTVIGTWAIVRHLRHDPYREPLLPWIGFFSGGIFGVGAITEWSFGGYAGPVSSLFVQTLMVGLCFRRFLPRFKLSKS